MYININLFIFKKNKMDDISQMLEQINFQEHNRNLYSVKFSKNKNVQQIKSFCEFIKDNYELNVYDEMYNNLSFKEKQFLDVIASLILTIVSNDNSFQILQLYYQIVDIYDFISKL